ncbi:sulfur carrier protein ThiS [Candidatus Sororendozoicomonas aggregata]|uniref:sulfur carrier protein ThiS n=1 Tax=Candidatus Sororendozoicomonas aggregata TaxID=3073239 RepID=UPI002ED1B0D4
MNILVNNQSVSLDKDTTLTGLLKHLKQPQSSIALAVNQQVISRSLWDTHTIKESDHITLITATAGG